MGKKPLPRLNVELKTPEDQQLYLDVQAVAKVHGLTLQEVMMFALRRALEELSKRTLPAHTVVRLAKKKPD